MTTLTDNQLINLAYEGAVFEVKFNFKDPSSSAIFVNAELFSEIYKKSETKTFICLAQGMQAMVGDFVVVPVGLYWTIAEIVNITDETALDLDYPEKYHFAISVIPKESIQEYANKILAQKEQITALKKQKQKVLRQRLKEAFFSEKANLLETSVQNIPKNEKMDSVDIKQKDSAFFKTDNGFVRNSEDEPS